MGSDFCSPCNDCENDTNLTQTNKENYNKRGEQKEKEIAELKEKLNKKEKENQAIIEELNKSKNNEFLRKNEIEKLEKAIKEMKQELQNKNIEIRRIEEIKKEEENRINSHNNINDNKTKELMKREKELINLEKNFNERNDKLNQKELNIENKEKILDNKNKEMNRRELDIENKEKNNENRIKELNKRELDIKNKEEDINYKNNELNQRELNIKIKEKNNESKNKELSQKELDIENMQKMIDNQNLELNQKQSNIRNKEKIIENKNNELNQREMNIRIKEENIKNKNTELNRKEMDIRNKEENIETKKIELNQKELNLKNKEKIIDNKNLQLSQKELEFKNKEKNLQQQMNEFEKNKNKIIDDLRNQQNVPILIGLNNIGATCYMNSTLQCLSNTNKLTEYFLTKYKQNKNRIMANAYYKLLLNLWDINKNNKSYSPYEFKEVLSKENPLFAGIAANDSKDLINFLIERFHQELNEVKTNNNINNNNINIQDQTNEQLMLNSFIKEFKEKFNSPISSLFYGMMETKSQCQGCQIIKYNFQVYSFLEFPLQQVNQFCYNNGKRPLFNNDGTNPDINLYECFDYYQKIDLMNGENQMYCNFCNKLCDSLYSTTIYSSPLNLIINLNRGRGAVYECKVNFPEQLILFNYVIFKDGFTAYQLYAVICHLGPSSMSGHFVAYCRNRIDNKWYLYNDGMVSLCSKQQQYQDGMPYILFYRALGE